MTVPYFVVCSGSRLKSMNFSPMHLIWDLQVFYMGSGSKRTATFLV